MKSIHPFGEGDGERRPALTAARGTYVLLLELDSARRLTVGRLGEFDFPAGWYAYAGSARGPGGLAARLRHHRRLAARPHWHLDYLRPHGRIAECWYGAAGVHDEHRWAAELLAMTRTAPVAPGFGSSDCACATHLVVFPTRPDIRTFRRRLSVRRGGTHGTIYRHVLEARPGR